MAKQLVRCQACDGAFVARRSTARFCGQECRDFVRRWATRTPRRAVPRVDVVECAGCGVAFERRPRPDDTAGRQPCCSPPCRARVARRALDCGEWTAVCDLCGVTFRPSGGRKGEQRTCSKRCAGLLRMTDWPSCRIYARCCAGCGVAFTSRHERTTCSTRCYNRTYRPAPEHHLCGMCSAVIPNTRSRCDDCIVTARRARKRRDKARRRALKAGALVEYVDPAVVFERDRWRCHLCAKVIPRDKVAPHPLSATIDHLVPLADLGPHSYANVKAAHFLCNARRGTRGIVQLALLG